MNPAETTTAHVKALVSHSLSTDGTSALFAFQVEELKNQLALVLPVPILGQMQALIFDMRRQVEQRNLGASYMQIHKPLAFAVGSSEFMRGHVVVTFDPNTANEFVFALRDEAAMKLVQLIIKNARTRHTSIIIPGG